MKDNFKRFYYKTNHLGKLQVFIRMYHLQNAVKVAKELDVSQPSITMQLKSLEELVECELFQKVGRKLIPTKYGHSFYKDIIESVTHIESTLTNFKNIKSSDTNREIKIAAHHIFTTRALGKYLTKLDKDIKIHILDISRDEAMKRLKLNEIDIAIYPMYEIHPGLISIDIATYKPLLVMQKENPLKDIEKPTPGEIGTQDVIRIDAKLITLPLFNEIYKQYKWHTNIKFDSPDWATLMHLVRNKLGVAVVSEICLEDDKDVIFKDLSHIFPNMTYTLSVNKSAFLPKSAINVIKLFDSNFAERLQSAIIL